MGSRPSKKKDDAAAPSRFTPDPAKKLTEDDTKLVAALNERNEMFVVADPALHDCPLVYVSPLFCRITGYSMKEINGKNCRFLQGEKTEKESVAKIRECLTSKKDTSVALLNYKKDGTCFYNQFFMSPLTSEDGTTAYFIGVQQEVRNNEPGQDGRNFGYRFRRAGMYVHLTEETKEGSTQFKPSKKLCKNDENFLAAVGKQKEAMYLVGDPHEQDMPVVFVSTKFVEKCGYGWDEIVGLNCRFFQGPNTSDDEVEKVREGIENKTDSSSMLVNYKRDGSTFNNQLFISPMLDTEGQVAYYCAMAQICETNAAGQEQNNIGWKIRNGKLA